MHFQNITIIKKDCQNMEFQNPELFLYRRENLECKGSNLKTQH